MNRHRKPRPLIIRAPAYRRAFQRLDEALEREPEIPVEEKIRELFGLAPRVSDELQPPGTVKAPE